MPNLVERRHERTRTEIADAAVDLFLARGFAETTMEDVAAASGVSRRTAYRHFPSKDDLVFEQQRRWLTEFDREISTPVAGETMRDLTRRGVLAVAALIRANAPPDSDIVGLTTAALDQLDPIWPEWLLAPRR